MSRAVGLVKWRLATWWRPRYHFTTERPPLTETHRRLRASGDGLWGLRVLTPRAVCLQWGQSDLRLRLVMWPSISGRQNLYQVIISIKDFVQGLVTEGEGAREQDGQTVASPLHSGRTEGADWESQSSPASSSLQGDFTVPGPRSANLHHWQQ